MSAHSHRSKLARRRLRKEELARARTRCRLYRSKHWEEHAHAAQAAYSLDPSAFPPRTSSGHFHEWGRRPAMCGAPYSTFWGLPLQGMCPHCLTAYYQKNILGLTPKSFIR